MHGRKLRESITDNLRILVGTGIADIAVDDYEQGEGDFVNSFDIKLCNKTFTSIQQVISAITNSYYCCTDDIKDWVFLSDQSALSTNALVNENNDLADRSEIEEWKRGELTLYNCNLFIPIQVVSQPRDMTEEEAESFGIEIY